jgi:hypothetical protein
MTWVKNDRSMMTSQVILVDTRNNQERSPSSEIFTQDGERTDMDCLFIALPRFGTSPVGREGTLQIQTVYRSQQRLVPP